MNKTKLQAYHLTASIHTLSVKWAQDDFVGVTCAPEDPRVQQCISPQQSEATRIWNSKVNPNRLNGDIFTFDDYNAAMDTIMADCGVTNYKIVRADLRLDSYDPDDYQRFAKLNRYLISAIALTYHVQNCYKTNDLWSEKQLSVAIRNKYIQLENYDKIAESGGKDLAAARLEEREIDPSGLDIQKAFTVTWLNRWDKAVKNLKAVEQRYNDELEKIWFEDKAKHYRVYLSLSEFLRQYQNCIFTRRQLIDLVTRTHESKDPEAFAKKFKKRSGIEYFSKQDVAQAISEIKRATLDFFSPQKVQAVAN